MIDNTPQPSSPRPAPALEPGRREPSRLRRLLLILLAAAIVGGAAAFLSLAGGNNVPTAILTAGGAFAGAIGVVLAVAHYAEVD